MRVEVYLPLLAAALFGLAGPWLTRRDPAPTVLSWALTTCAALAGLTSVWSLTLLAGCLLDEVLPAGYPRVGLLAGPGLTADLVGLLALAWLVAAAIRVGRQLRDEHATYRQIKDICAGRDGLVVLADPAPQAFAAPIGGGRVVVSTSMLAALSPAQRRVLFAHERAHLRGRHHWHTRVARLAAAINPFLTPLVGPSTYLCERRADEAAAQAVGDRRLAASALARAALAATGQPDPLVRVARSVPGPSGLAQAAGLAAESLAYHQVGVGARVAALSRPPAAWPRLRAGLALLIVAAVTVGTVLADIDATERFFLPAHHRACEETTACRAAQAR